MVTLTLGVALIVKYILFDKPAKTDLRSMKRIRFANGKEHDGEKREGEALFPLGHMKTWHQSPALDLYRKTVDGAGCAGDTRTRSAEEFSQSHVPSEDALPGATESTTSAAGDAGQLSDAQFTIGSAPASRRPSISLAVGGSISDQLERVSEQLNETLSEAADVTIGRVEEEEGGREGVRTLDACSSLLAAGRAAELSDDEVVQLVQTKRLPAYKLESSLDDPERGVSIRRRLLCQDEAVETSLEELPYSGYDYSKVCASHQSCGYQDP